MQGNMGRKADEGGGREDGVERTEGGRAGPGGEVRGEAEEEEEEGGTAAEGGREAPPSSGRKALRRVEEGRAGAEWWRKSWGTVVGGRAESSSSSEECSTSAGGGEKHLGAGAQEGEGGRGRKGITTNNSSGRDSDKKAG